MPRVLHSSTTDNSSFYILTLRLAAYGPSYIQLRLHLIKILPLQALPSLSLTLHKIYLLSAYRQNATMCSCPQCWLQLWHALIASCHYCRLDSTHDNVLPFNTNTTVIKICNTQTIRLLLVKITLCSYSSPHCKRLNHSFSSAYCYFSQASHSKIAWLHSTSLSEGWCHYQPIAFYKTTSHSALENSLHVACLASSLWWRRRGSYLGP